MYIHKYRPHSLKDITYNKDVSNNLTKLANLRVINNMLVYGINGSGKKTFVLSYLADIYGCNIFNIRSNNIVTNKIDTDLKYKNSSYHIEIDLSKYSSANKKKLIEFIKVYSSTLNVVTKEPKIIIFTNADMLPLNIQYTYL